MIFVSIIIFIVAYFTPFLFIYDGFREKNIPKGILYCFLTYTLFFVLHFVITYFTNNYSPKEEIIPLEFYLFMFGIPLIIPILMLIRSLIRK